MNTQLPFVCLDIETRARPERVAQFTPPFAPFVREEVKCGNIKDPVKIAEKIAASEAEHIRAEAAYWQKANEQAALHPLTGEIAVIGILTDDGMPDFLEGDERTILSLFWSVFGLPGDPSRVWVVWSGSGASDRNFDFDFIITRSRLLGVPIPAHVRRGRYYSDRIVDLASEFLLHRRDAYLSLTKAADAFGLYDAPITIGGVPTQLRRKRDDDPVTGATFAAHWDADGEKRELARSYLVNDLNHTLALARRIL